MTTNKQQYYVLPVEHLPEAEKFFSGIDRLVAPYLEAVQKNSFEDFFDEVVESIPEAGDNEDYYFCKKKGVIENYDILCDDLFGGIETIRSEIEGRVPIIPGYDLHSSKKLDDHSIIFKYVESPDITK